MKTRIARTAFAMRPIAQATLIALGALAHAVAQAQTQPQPASPADATSAAPQQLERVEITGSSIKRIDAETALPVQIIRREDIERGGSTTAAELLSKVSASTANLTDGASFSDISGQRGFNGANLRGIGVSSTLVLLNGRRLANFASPGNASGVDLNTIPAAAIDRVEILKDGASAIYGSDAIGGVINFITRRDYRGIDLAAYYGDTQHGGAGKQSVTLSGGTGNIDTDRYNLFAVLDVQDTKPLRSTQRDWIGSAYQPDINLDVGSSNTFPANVRITRPDGSPTGSRLNPSAPNCNPPATIYAPDSFVGSSACLYDYMHDTEVFPESKRTSLMTRGEYRLAADHTLFAEYLYSQTRTTYRISPLTLTNLNYPADGPYYPTSLGVSGPLRINMRLEEAGPRTNQVDADAQRLLLGAKGVLAGWDYDGAFNHSVSNVTDAYVNGYVRTSAFDDAFLSGQINPFGASGATGQGLLAAAKISDDARKSRGTTDSIDLKGSRDLFAMAGGPAAVAVGAEYRHEKLEFNPSQLLQEGEIRGDGAATPFSGGRTVAAVFAEFNLPVVKTLEAQLALRYDHYSDVGSTTNPKVGLRWTPLKEFLVRSSYGTGFRAPSLADLYTPERLGQTNGIYNDPLGCIATSTIDNTDNPDYCGIQPDKLVGGSANLKPEKSKQFSLGLVVEPARGINASVDYWRIEKTNVVTSAEGVYFSDPVRYAAYITRGPADPSLPGIPGPITSIDSRLRNIGALTTSGVDLGLEWRLPATEYGKFGVTLNGTYVIDYKTQEGDGAPYVSAVGVFSNDQVIQRWRHVLTFDYDYGPVALTLQQTYLRGYQDQNPGADGQPRRVDAYQLWDASGSYQATKALKVRVGVKNLFDRNPPSSNQIYSFLAGYDPNYTDPRGRFFYVSAQYAFR